MRWRGDLQRTEPMPTPAGDVVLTARTAGNGIRFGPAALFRTAARPHTVEIADVDGTTRSMRIFDVTGAIVTTLRIATAIVVVWSVTQRIRKRR